MKKIEIWGGLETSLIRMGDDFISAHKQALIQEKDLIKKALEKHRGRRKNAAQELGISERTLYRKIKEYNLSE